MSYVSSSFNKNEKNDTELVQLTSNVRNEKVMQMHTNLIYLAIFIPTAKAIDNNYYAVVAMKLVSTY